MPTDEQQHEYYRGSPVDSLAVTVITDNYYDKLRPDQKIAHRARIGHGTSMHSEHGLSYLIEATASGRTQAFMFDYGVEGEGIVKNMKLLGIDVGSLAAFALSHGHYDHWGSLIYLLKKHKAQIRRGAPLYVGDEAFARRFSRPPVKGPGDVQKEPEDLGQLAREKIERLGLVEVVEITSPTEVVPGAFLTGNIERVTAYEKGFARLLIKRGNTLEPDLFQGEQALVFNMKGKGLVVVSSCAHAGIINTIRHAQKNNGCRARPCGARRLSPDRRRAGPDRADVGRYEEDSA